MKEPKSQRGATMIEVLVAMLVIAFGLLGMAGLQVRMQVAELEAYQRSQALMLLNDMASRIATNRLNASLYVTGTTMGVGVTDCTTLTATDSRTQTDLREWCTALQGAAETSTKASTTLKQGVMVGGRGCVQSVGGDYLVTVAWQGMTPISAPPSSVTCGANSYDGTTGSACINDLCRRVVTTLVRIGSLT